MMFLFALLVVVAFACHVQAKGVFAHYMLGNSNNYTKEDWKADIRAAKAAKIDAFALNTGFNDAVEKGLKLAFATANEMDFKLFLSLDYSGDGNWPKDQVVNTLRNYANNTAYYRHKDNKPLVSTFEGAQAANDWASIKTKVDCFFMPDWSSTDPRMSIATPGVDGLMSWNAWPNGTDTPTTAIDDKYMDALNGKPYIMPVSPWFYTNMARYHKNWVWRGDDVWHTRWEQVLDVDPDYVEIISWNDFGESHYIGPLHASGLSVFGYADAPFDYASDMPHDAWREFLPYMIDLYKSGGKEAKIEKEGVVAWYRINPAAACGSGKTTGNTETQHQKIMKPEEVLTEKIFYSALLDEPADVSVSIGGQNKSATWSSTPKGGKKGLYHGNVEIDGRRGDVVVTLTREKELLAQMKGHAITIDCQKNLTNWNAWVGNATATGKRASSAAEEGEEGAASARAVITGLFQVTLGLVAYFALV